MTHCHLTLDLSCSLNDNTYNDDDGGASECQSAHRIICEEVDDHGEYCNDRKEDSADKCDSVKNLCDVIRCGLTGTDTGDGAAVLLKVIGYLYRVERDQDVEVSKSDDKNEGKHSIEPAVCCKQIEEAGPERVLLCEEHLQAH